MKLVLLLDIGNSALHLGLARGSGIVWHRSVSDRVQGFESHRIPGIASTDRICGAVISSVVPGFTRQLAHLVQARLGLRPLVVSHRLPTGLKLEYRRPTELGADRLANAVAAWHGFRRNVIVVDMGTATTIEAVTRDGRLLGGAILPGLGLMASALHLHTARLPTVSLNPPARFLGRTTRAGISSGVFAAHFAGIGHVISRIEAETRRNFYVIATGGLSRRYGRLIPGISLIEPLLTLQGLRILFELHTNRRKNG